MKTAAIAALAFAICGIHGASSQSIDDPFGGDSTKEDEKPHKYKLSKDLRSCPDDHKTLKDIPIIYGNVGPLIKKPKDYTDDDRNLAEREKRGEVVFGGDSIPTNPPRFRVICQTCGYSFDNPFPKDFPDFAGWTRSATDPKEFKRALSKRLLGAPRITPVKGSISYRQSTDSNGENVIDESVSYRSTEKPPEIVARIRKWMEVQKLDTKELRRHEDAHAHHTYSFSGDTVLIHIIDSKFWNPGEVSVSISIDHRRR